MVPDQSPVVSRKRTKAVQAKTSVQASCSSMRIGLARDRPRTGRRVRHRQSRPSRLLSACRRSTRGLARSRLLSADRQTLAATLTAMHRPTTLVPEERQVRSAHWAIIHPKVDSLFAEPSRRNSRTMEILLAELHQTLRAYGATPRNGASSLRFRNCLKAESKHVTAGLAGNHRLTVHQTRALGTLAPIRILVISPL